jgi:hypothetical protein
MTWNWTIITIIVCTMLIGSQISSALGSLRSALADELDKIKEQLDQLKQSNREEHVRRWERLREVLDRVAPDPDPLNRMTAEDWNRMTPEKLDLFMKKRAQLLDRVKGVTTMLDRLTPDPDLHPLDRMTPEQISRLTPGQLDLLLTLQKEKS